MGRVRGSVLGCSAGSRITSPCLSSSSTKHGYNRALLRTVSGGLACLEQRPEHTEPHVGLFCYHQASHPRAPSALQGPALCTPTGAPAQCYGSPRPNIGCRAGLSKLPTRPEPEQTRELDHPLDPGEGQKQQNSIRRKVTRPRRHRQLTFTPSQAWCTSLPQSPAGETLQPLSQCVCPSNHVFTHPSAPFTKVH